MTTTLRELSHSALQDYSACPAKYNHRWNLDSPRGEPGEPAIRGTLFHAFARRYIEHCQQTGYPTDLSAVPHMLADVFRGGPESLYDEAHDLVTRFVESHQFPVGGEYFVEQNFGGEIEGYHFTGHPDLVYVDEDRVRVTDWKTYWRIMPQSAVDSDVQLERYALLAWLHFGRPEQVEAEIDHVRYGVVRRTVKTAEDLERVAKRLIEQAEAIEADTTFQARPGDACTWCEYTGICPAFRHRVTTDTAPVTDEVSAGEAARRFIVLKRALEDTRKELQPWCNARGLVEVGGVEVGYHRVESYEYPVGAVVALLRERNMPLLDFVRADTAAVKKLLHGDMGPDLERIRVDRSKTSFDVRRVAE